ncbi:hypothetical protein [Capybara microvirus Cap3_SP_332]|nr:hypothetical protein [Capybara microvirus Cap3_SP_332]
MITKNSIKLSILNFLKDNPNFNRINTLIDYLKFDPDSFVHSFEDNGVFVDLKFTPTSYNDYLISALSFADQVIFHSFKDVIEVVFFFEPTNDFKFIVYGIFDDIIPTGNTWADMTFYFESCIEPDYYISMYEEYE